MKQVVQPASGGPVRVMDVPRPIIGPTEVLVQTAATLISAGTERAVTELARSNIVQKAKARPDLVRQVVRKARTEGLAQTARTVRARLAQDVPLGYSGAGIAVEVGEAVSGIQPGQLVATGGAGKANHAEWQAVPGLLCTPVPDGVSPEQASFATVASVALHGLRLSETTPGSTVVVIGLGLVGQLAARQALAAGCRVIGLDVAEFPIERASAAGIHAMSDEGDATTDAVLGLTRGRGADAVIVCAADRSSSVIRRAPALCRDRGIVVVVGDVGLDLERTPLYEKELTLRVARSYGPGRYDLSYEGWAVDYPVGHVRWTEGRNQEAVLDLLAGGRLVVDDLVTHRFPIEGAEKAYELVESRAEPYLGVVLDYPVEAKPERPIMVRPPQTGGTGVGLIGAGAFAASTLIPAFKTAGFDRFVSVASSSGLSARRLAEQAGFEKAVSGADAVIDDPDVDVVVIATPHDTHASLAARALRAGKHVWCEKPLALTEEELDDVEAAWQDSGKVLFVGFNRRYSPAVQAIREHFAGGSGPLVITYRVNAGPIPPGHWYEDRRQGGRLIGEVCHFVDTCAAVVGLDPIETVALGQRAGERGRDNAVVSLRFEDGSLATISYASGGPPTVEKERIDLLGRGRAGLVVDFARTVLDGRSRRFAQDKGHATLATLFHRAVDGGDAPAVSFATSRAVLAVIPDTLSSSGSRRIP